MADFPLSIKKLLVVSFKRAPLMAWSTAFLICFTVTLIDVCSRKGINGGLEDFEVGRVAERDIFAAEPITYIDEQASRLILAAQERLVPGVFIFSFSVTDEQKNRFKRFSAMAENIPEEAGISFWLSVEEEFPGYFSQEAMELLINNPDRQVLLRSSETVLNSILDRGIYSMPETGMENRNPDVLEIIRQSGSRIEKERIPLANILNMRNALEETRRQITAGFYPAPSRDLALMLLEPFLRENVFYSAEETALMINDVRARTEPVIRYIEQGRQIIKRGFVITEDEMMELRVLQMSLPEHNLALIFANSLFLLALFIFLPYFCGERIIGRSLTDSETYLTAGLSALYIAGCVLLKHISEQDIPVSVFVPTALVILIPSILISPRLSLVLAAALPLGAFLTGSFNMPSYFFALSSGIAAAYSLQDAEKRNDLVKAGLLIGAANLAAMTAALLWQHSPIGVYPRALFGAAINGIASGMLVLGFLSPLEQALNAATSFRLIELSDLNVPILKRLFTAAPGTYSHSIMVANLAETACQDIGANSLLARVGAYYHDLGKMENPEYFVENQKDFNIHDGMEPRLSATVIRSHVKLGVEKARKLKLPKDVIDIISEHHGNSVITWFYSKALKQNEANKNSPVNLEDYVYPGYPPHSRESAIVMLADMAEAAVKSLDKPSAQEIEIFVQDLISKKVEHGQLAQAELTFRDLEIIKNAFVKVLSGYYHNRIEYPRIEK